MKFTEETVEQAVIELFDAVQIPHCKCETIIYQKVVSSKMEHTTTCAKNAQVQKVVCAKNTHTIKKKISNQK